MSEKEGGLSLFGLGKGGGKSNLRGRWEVGRPDQAEFACGREEENDVIIGNTNWRQQRPGERRK